MILARTQRFKKDFARLPPPLQERARKQLALLLTNPRHPSLQVKKLKGYENLWEGRVTQHYRFTFRIEGETLLLLRIATHDLLRHPE
ncbi:MAG: type II toxin-antitoxin system RelE/ParE family toxin [Candidatus Methylomirabilales bacterium]